MKPNKGKPAARPSQDKRAESAPAGGVQSPVGPGPRSSAESPTPPAVKVAPMFRRIDWFAFGFTTLFVLVGYLWTLAPDLTLEDSGELAVASMYAGVPHPPGYPIWTIYSWLFTVLVPISNIAFRVALSSALAAAFSCGLVALMVSRGSSMMMEGIAEFRDIERRLESAICLVSGCVAGLLIGFHGTMWSQAVIVEVYTFSALSLAGVLACLMRWIYAPQQNRYLYLSFFLFALCFNNHQSLLVMAMGLEVAVLAARPSLGRQFFLWNIVIYLLGLVLKAKGEILTDNIPLFIIFNLVGFASIVAYIYAWVQTKEAFTLPELKVSTVCGLVWVVGLLFYFYLPLASMSNPPMNWAYPRTVEGFVHALTRGQYDHVRPTQDAGLFFLQVWEYLKGANSEFNFVSLLLALVPFFFLTKMQRRERAWWTGLVAMYLFLSFFLLVLLNPGFDRQSKDLNKVFFTASHMVIAMAIGYGLTLIAAALSTQFERYRRPALGACAIAAGFALYGVAKTVMETPHPLVRYTSYYGLALALGAVALILVNRTRAPIRGFLVLFALLPIHSIMSHWEDNEQRGHLFGFWFGHDMFSPPIEGKDGKPLYPELTRDAVVFGGTDPGRFNPTYMIFAESFTPPSKKRDPSFDRRDAYLITQNALADVTYLNYIRAHYNRSAQIDPPFFMNLLRPESERMFNYTTNGWARLMIPLDRFFMGLGDSIEKSRVAGSSYFVPEHLLETQAFARELAGATDAAPLAKHVFSQLTPATQAALRATGATDASLKPRLIEDLNALLEARPLFETNRFAGVKLSSRTLRFVNQNPRGHSRIRLNRLLLEEAFPKFIAKSQGGLYPDLEIHTPTGDEMMRCFHNYYADAERRFLHDQANPSGPRLMKPGEDAQVVGGKVQVTGQSAVMSINGLLTQIIFDKNPDHEFFIEESFPLDWMFPYLTPYGIIMKLNREPLTEFTEDIYQTDREFWSRYSERLIGNWIREETTVEEVCAFVERVYHRRDYSGFTGDRKFIRDSDAQKSFSKLRTSTAGLYAWRVTNSKTAVEQQRALKEADFAFRQAFAFCPYSPEVVFRYVQILAGMGRFMDASRIADSAYTLDPGNGQLRDLAAELGRIKAQSGAAPGGAPSNTPLADPESIPRLEAGVRVNPNDVQSAYALVTSYVQSKQFDKAAALAEQIADHTNAQASAVLFGANVLSQLGKFGKAEKALVRATSIQPDNPEAWFDLAGVQATLEKKEETLASLRECVKLSAARRQRDTNSSDLAAFALTDQRFAPYRESAEFKEIFERAGKPAR